VEILWTKWLLHHHDLWALFESLLAKIRTKNGYQGHVSSAQGEMESGTTRYIWTHLIWATEPEKVMDWTQRVGRVWKHPPEGSPYGGTWWRRSSRCFFDDDSFGRLGMEEGQFVIYDWELPTWECLPQSPLGGRCLPSRKLG